MTAFFHTSFLAFGAGQTAPSGRRHPEESEETDEDSPPIAAEEDYLMNDLGWLHLQRFAGEGAGNGGGDGAGTGDAAADAGQTGNPAPMSAEEAREKRLLELEE